MPPLSRHKVIAAASETTTISRLDLYNHDMSADLQGMYYNRVHSEEDCRDVIVGLEPLNIALDCKTGVLSFRMSSAVAEDSNNWKVFFSESDISHSPRLLR